MSFQKKEIIDLFIYSNMLFVDREGAISLQFSKVLQPAHMISSYMLHIYSKWREIKKWLENCIQKDVISGLWSE